MWKTFSFQVYPKLSQTYYVLLECLAQDHMNFLSTLEPHVFLYILSSISEGLSAIGKCSDSGFSRVSAIQTSRWLPRIRRGWAGGSLGSLFKGNCQSGQLQTTGLQVMDAHLSIYEAASSIEEVKVVVAKLRGGKAAGICNMSAELLKAGGEAMICGLHAVLTVVWHSGTIPPDWRRGLVVPIWKDKGTVRMATTTAG